MTTLEQSNDLIIFDQPDSKLIVFRSINVDDEILKEVRHEIKEYEQDMADINFIMEQVSELVGESKVNLDKIEQTIEKINEEIVETNKDLQDVSEVMIDNKYRYLKITGGALLGGLCLGGVGAFFGIVPAVVGVCAGIGAGAGIGKSIK